MNWGNVKKIIIKILIIYYLLFLGLKLLDYYYFHFRELSQTFPDVHYFFRHYISPFSALMLLIIYVILKFDSYGAYDGISESSTVKEMKSILQAKLPRFFQNFRVWKRVFLLGRVKISVFSFSLKMRPTILLM